MRNIIILLVVFSLNAQAQSKRLIEVAREFTTKDIILSDGLVYKWKIGATNDTARYFNAGGDEYEVIATFKKVGGVDPDPDPDPVTQTIDGESLIYAGWFRHGSTSDPSWYGGTISYSSTGEAMYTFTGTGVELHGETGPSHGTGTISVGAQSKTVSWRSDTRKLPAKVGEFTGLPQGQHTIVIKPVSGTILIDFLVITK